MIVINTDPFCLILNNPAFIMNDVHYNELFQLA